MNQIAFMQLLQRLARDHKKKIFSLREISALASISRPAAGMLLLRASRNHLVFRARNLWVNLTDPPELIEVGLALASPSYLSFESALYHHNVLSQSPRGGLALVTTGRPRQVETPLGTIRFTHLKPGLFFGYDENRIALPEKAWLDLLYIRGRKGRSGMITETFYLRRLNRQRLRSFAARFPEWVQYLAEQIQSGRERRKSERALAVEQLEDEIDLEAYRQRRSEETVPLEQVLAGRKKSKG